MKKRNLLVSALVLLLLNSCKKDSQPTTIIPADDVQAQGTWTLSSVSGDNNGVLYSYASSSLPCMEGNKLIINADGSASLEYTLQDTCFSFKNANSYGTIGMPGDKRAATWTQKGKTVYVQIVNQSKPVVGTLSLVSSKQQLTLNDTTYYLQSKYIEKAVYVK